MAPKAQKRSLRTTRPRRNAARIAQERARRSTGRGAGGRDNERSTEKRRVTTGRGNKKKVPGRATRVRRREARTEVRRGRFLILVAFMAVLGFTTVYLGEAALSTIQSLGQDGGKLWDKVVDRLLDRDIPVGKKPAATKPDAAKAKPRAAPKAKALEQRPPLPQRKPPEVRVEKLPKAPVPSTPRAERPAPSPVEYARETGAKAPATTRSEADASRERAARIEAILEKVGVER